LKLLHQGPGQTEQAVRNMATFELISSKAARLTEFVPPGAHIKIIAPITGFSEIIDQITVVQASGRTGQRIPLIDSGCSGDCRKACQDPNLMFNSTFTLWNCVTLATAATLVQNGSLQLGDTSVAEQLLHFGNLTDFNSTKVYQNLVTCTTASCTGQAGKGHGECPPATLSLANKTITAGFVDEIRHGLQDYCEVIADSINADIAGPGVR
jgi:hypothetical protein